MLGGGYGIVPLVGILTNQTATGSALASYQTAKSVINAGSIVTLPPNYFYLGKRMRISALMGISNLVTAQCTFTFQVQLGPTSAIVAWTSGAIKATTSAHVTLPTTLVIDLKCDAVGTGTSAKLIGAGILGGVVFTTGAVADGTYGSGIVVPVTAPADGTGFDSTVTNLLDFWVGIQTSDPANGIQVFNYCVEDLN